MLAGGLPSGLVSTPADSGTPPSILLNFPIAKKGTKIIAGYTTLIKLNITYCVMEQEALGHHDCHIVSLYVLNSM